MSTYQPKFQSTEAAGRVIQFHHIFFTWYRSSFHNDLKNTDMICIIAGENEIKLDQFVNNHTLIFDGNLHSLQSALNTLEMFGTFSALIINKDKT